MPLKYYGEVYIYNCPKCHKQAMGKNYYALSEKAEMGAAKNAGLIAYKCNHCGAIDSAVRPNGETAEVSAEEALSGGLAFQSKGLQ
jgi:hypothetical protein